MEKMLAQDIWCRSFFLVIDEVSRIRKTSEATALLNALKARSSGGYSYAVELASV
jgi:hypothetical protein